MTEKRFNIEFDGHKYFLVIDEDNERCLARLDTRMDALVWLEMYKMLSEENERLKRDNEDLTIYLEQANSTDNLESDKMTAKRFNYVAFDGFEDNEEYISPHQVVELLNEFHEENEQLKQQLNDFKFDFTQNFVTESNKDELYVEDAHTKIEAKNGIMWITVFIPQNNEFIKIKYRISKQDVMREYLKSKEVGK